MEKAEKIKKSIEETKQVRKNQVIRVFELKLQNLSKRDIEKFERLFLEAKWLYNFIIADIENRLNDNAWKLKEVEIKTPDGLEKREIITLSSQMRQGIVERIRDSLKALKKAKEKGIKVGSLKFKSEVRSIPLKQYGITYKIIKDKNKVKIQGIKKKFRILGLHQISENAEITYGVLIKKPDGFYLHITCCLFKDELLKKIKEKQRNSAVGIDLGVKYQITLSNGEKFEWFIPETKRVKKL
ncbi:hypothetical protein HRbin19_00826 [bacterium HR19]|nr:hypothetical protein HRbin19_00826 [bacterium HR19]